ncbi:hypothetical protein A0J48_003605 [Sphaerospermopsis aphanizomenoides BCCUSP55]|uniref:hypothetical protein n=1 Tax=Sphaerospermopsis aphanizomenoides TaxID=459663 RepID=UPI000ABDF7A9|nr:hypothetical protein [Sphaerospermopsis aphanizomenoides]MBK1986634.1 hypothetical protein [Sphaerospermopsis aphanizomenoides BCCUSP55]
MSKNNQPSKKPYQRNIPIWKATIIQFLRGTIGVLENTVVKLETDTPVSTENKPNFLQRVLSSWDRFLRTFRLFLPSSVSNNLSDPVLTGILAGVAVVIVWTTTTLLTSKPAEVATLPPVEEVTVPTPTPTVVVSPEPTSTTTLEPEVEPQPTFTPEPEVEIIPTSEPEPIPTPTLEAEPEVEITPTPEPEIEPEPIPTPSVKLTPEQALIVAIENQLAEIRVSLNRKEEEIVSTNLIKSIQVNFRTSDLTLKISDDWYTLETEQQNQWAADILQRSQELDFNHLEILDSQDKLIARNPVVGNEMVIFKRRNLIKSQLNSSVSDS